MLSQEAKVLRAIKLSGNKGFPNYKFPQMGVLRYSARIGDLRKEGHNIYCERVRRNGRATGTFLYFLNDETDEPKKKRWFNR